MVKKKKPVIKKKKPVVKKKAMKKAPTKKLTGVEDLACAGEVTHYFPHVQAAVLKLKCPLCVGDKIKVRGHTTEFDQDVNSIQIDRVAITEGKRGDEIGLMVTGRVRRGDLIYKC